MHENCNVPDPRNAHYNFPYNKVLADCTLRNACVSAIPWVAFVELRNSWPSIWWTISVSFCKEVKLIVNSCRCHYSMNNEFTWVVWPVKDNNVALGIICFEVFGVDTLDNNNVANVQRSIERMSPAVANTIIGDTHAATNNRQRRGNLCIECNLTAIPKSENYCND